MCTVEGGFYFTNAAGDGGVRKNNCKTVFMAARNRLKIYYCLLTLFLRLKYFFYIAAAAMLRILCQCGFVFVLCRASLKERNTTTPTGSIIGM